MLPKISHVYVSIVSFQYCFQLIRLIDWLHSEVGAQIESSVLLQEKKIVGKSLECFSFRIYVP